MTFIKKINNDLVKKIAAGEVIERPESIIKELVENSIDAKSKKIDIYIKEGGISSIIIKDDGIGIDENEIDIAFKSHTTSKINSIKDLDSIYTLGFRGEALSSIASVSHISISTSSDGTLSSNADLIDGEISKISSGARTRGTTISVNNLFNSFPARKKFLKSPETELARITKVLKKFFLAYPDIEFNYFSEKKLIYALKPTSMINRIIDIFGSQYKDKLLDVNSEKGHYIVEGYIANLDILKKRPGDQYLFINNRPIKSKMVHNSIISSYSSLIQRGEYPFFSINIKTSPSFYDINVHPMKKEILFKEEWKVNQIIKESIKQSIASIPASLPNYNFKPYNQEIQTTERINFKDSNLSQMSIDSVITSGISKDIDEKIDDILKREKSIEIDDLWQIDNKYIITKLIDGVVIIDQHVAHERILYESAIKALETKEVDSQAVLFPKTVEFAADDYDILIKLLPYINKIGFKLREFGDRTIIIEGVPVYIKNDDEVSIINEIISKYDTYGNDELEIHDKLAANYSCKAAIKAGDHLEDNEMKYLVNKLFQTQNPYYCPHGRPIIVNLSTEDLDKRFERI
tara:strand:+ start:61850 stop:63577 length:1728 start_codon:yes stop_codon:yes gene_type:complete